MFSTASYWVEIGQQIILPKVISMDSANITETIV